jgi:hypothetical protein
LSCSLCRTHVKYPGKAGKKTHGTNYDLFSGFLDSRIERNKLYLLEEVIVITILATIATAQGWEDIEWVRQSERSLAEAVSETGTWDTAPQCIPADLSEAKSRYFPAGNLSPRSARALPVSR